MAKIVFANIPAHGHTNPTLPVVRGLVENGHHVLYYSTEEFRQKITPTGVDFRPYQNPMPTTAEVTQRMKSMIDASLTMMEMSENQTGWMIEEMRREQPDLIIYDTTAMWGYIAARILDIPSICSVTHFVLEGVASTLPKIEMIRYILSAIPKLPRVFQWKRTMNKQFGKDNVGGITEYADLNLVFTSQEFHPGSSFVDDRFHFVGPSIDLASRNDADFAVTGDTTTVYISLGTVNNANMAFYRTVFEAFAEYPVRFIMSVGASTDIAELQPIPDNFTVYPYVPQLQVLQQVDVFITHGGMNSVHEGLYYGVPEIVVPQQIEQLANGLRVRDVGAGELIWHRDGTVTMQELRFALDKILADDTYRENASYYGQTLKDAGGFQQAIHEIESFIDHEIRELKPA